MFKLIAIETLRPTDPGIVKTPRYKSIHKIMSFTEEDYEEGKPAEHIYYLCKGYECRDSNTLITDSDSITTADFFTSTGTHISFAAIVGENGMGKSTLLELFFRLMNNASYALRSGIDSTIAQKLLFVLDLNVRAYFEDTNGGFYSIEQSDNRITYYNQKNPDLSWSLSYQEILNNTLSKDVCINRLSNFFYTVVVNYAAYAYNTTDYIREWDALKGVDTRSGEDRCWLSSLFHKNDSYQTPIVLNPFRESGNVDFNNERSLTQERLFRLVLNQQSPLKRILHKKDAKAIIFDLNLGYLPKYKKNHYESERVVLIMQQLGLLENKKNYKAEISNIGDCIIQAWNRTMGFKLSGPDNQYWKDQNREQVCAINYLVYKTLKIICTYPSYQSFKIKLLQKPESRRALNGILRESVKKMYGDRSHITLKIRRCLAFLLFRHYSSIQFSGSENALHGNIIPIGILKEKMEKCIGDATRYTSIRTNESNKVTIISYAQKNPIKWTYNELMPASFFHTDLLLQDDDGHEVNFNSLSSGEKQMIHSMSAILYQIGNIESAWKNKAKMAHYTNICLVFDEVELYFHPKYQLKLIAFLIDTLQGLQLEKITDIQIILATHSPFILSDIPVGNILMLKDGMEYIPNEKSATFGANVYDLLNSQFFMDRFVGDFANQKIDNLIERLKSEDDFDSKNISLLSREIDIIGDSFIRGMLRKKLSIKSRHD